MDSTRILLVLPFWTGDRMKMEKVARLACDLLESPTNQVEILFVARFDTDFPKGSFVEEIAKKIPNINLWRCPRKGVGFPAGCNEIALGIFEHVLKQRDGSYDYNDISCIFIIESDCVITRRTWVSELCAEWDNTIEQGKFVAGALQTAVKWGTDIGDHINAVALYDPDILCYLPCLSQCPPNRGWDSHYGPEVVPYAVDSKLFKLDYKRATITSEELFRDKKTLVLHGVKDDSAIKAVREMYGI
jgi:hypothetical protein